jgi:hypothetical protein
LPRHPVRTVEFPAEAPQELACAACERKLPRRVRFCPYCAAEQVEKAPTASPKTEDNVIVAEFGFRDVEQSPPPTPPPPAPAPPPPAPAEPVAHDRPKASANTAPSPPSPPVAEQKSASPTSAPTHQEPVARPLGNRKGFIVFYAALFLLAVLVLISLLGGPRQVPAQSPAPVVAAPVTLYALRDDTVVRSQPTAIGSYSPGNLHRGDPVTGEWQAANTAGYRWLKITSGQWTGDYVWDRNLAESPPPALVTTFNTFETTGALTDVYPRPDLSATKLQTVSPGRRIFVSGEIEGGWYEIRLRRGGVGYALAADFK